MPVKPANMNASEAGAPRPFLHDVLERVCMGQYFKAFKSTKKLRCFRPQTMISYAPYCDDFGPMNVASIAKFIELLDEELSSFPAAKIVYTVDAGRRALTNAVFLLGAYLILKLNKSAEEASEAFSWLDASLIESYRDATFSTPDFGLSVHNCWQALAKGKELNWFSIPNSSDPPAWGQTYMDEYQLWDNPLNGDMHVVVPNLFVAFRGPTDLGGEEYSDANRYRVFSPAFYLDVFKQLGVTDVVRLNEADYDARAFSDHGIAHHDLPFEDCTAPPPGVVDRFLAAVDAARGMVAVHCKAGLGRTGTLIALYLMQRRGFTAREAMGWLRIMRPGCVIGEQQRYLCAADAAAAAAAGEGHAADAGEVEEEDRLCGCLLADAACGGHRASCQELASQVSHALVQRSRSY